MYCLVGVAAASEEVYGTRENAENCCAELGIWGNSECNLSAEAMTMSVNPGWHLHRWDSPMKQTFYGVSSLELWNSPGGKERRMEGEPLEGKSHAPYLTERMRLIIQ